MNFIQLYSILKFEKKYCDFDVEFKILREVHVSNELKKYLST